MSKKLYGIGFQDLQVFNQALLVKQAWRILHDPSGGFSMFEDFLQASSGTRPSYAWRSMIFGRELLEKRLKRSIGNGEDTFFWVDNWLYNHFATRPGGCQPLMNINLKVANLIDPGTHKWNAQILNELFTKRDIQLIKKYKPIQNIEDTFVWELTDHGCYLVKSGYDFMSRRKHKDLFQYAAF